MKKTEFLICVITGTLAAMSEIDLRQFLYMLWGFLVCGLLFVVKSSDLP